MKENKKNTKVNVNVEVTDRDVKDIRNLLWKLCYKPEETLCELELDTNIAANDVIDYILQQCEEERINLFFAGKIPCVDTLGVEIGIKNAVVRDILLEHASNAVENYLELAGRASTLLTKNYPEYQEEAKKIGGLKAIRFTDEEANYLYKTCNLHPVGLFLKRLIAKKQEKSEKLVETAKTVPNIEIQEVPLVQEGKVSEVKNEPNEPKETFKAAAIIKNKELVQKFLKVSEDVNLDTLDKDIEDLQIKLNHLLDVKNLQNDLVKNNVSVDMLKRTEKIQALLAAIEALES